MKILRCIIQIEFDKKVTMDEKGVTIFSTKCLPSKSDSALHCRKAHDPAAPPPPSTDQLRKISMEELVALIGGPWNQSPEPK